MTDWITDRPPTEKDGDKDGFIRMKLYPGGDVYDHVHWSFCSGPWCHSEFYVLPAPEPTPMDPHWITDRLPTREDADDDGDVRVCTSPKLNLEDFVYEKWNIVTLGWPWRHSHYCARTPVAPEPTPAAPEPKKATRGFAQIIWGSNNEQQYAIATDGTAWHRDYVYGTWCDWEQVQPLPQPGEE